MGAPTVDDILYELTHLPPDVNPFEWLSTYLTSFFIPHYSSTTKVQLYLIISLHALCVFIIAGSLWLRYRRGHLWLCRWQLSRTIVEPNLATVPACAAIIEMALFEFLFAGILEMMENDFTPYYGYAILLVGVLPAIVGELVTWSIAVGFCLHCHKMAGSTKAVRTWARLCNLGLMIPIVHFGAFLPLNVLVGRSYRDAITYYEQINAFLADKSSSWVPGTAFDFTALVPLVEIFASLQATFLRLAHLWKIAYAFHACAALLLIVALGSIATLYLRSVGKVIKRARDEYNDSGRGGETLSRVQQTWTLLVIVLSMFLILASFSLCLSLYAAVHPLETPQAYVFTSFWSSAILSTLCSSLLLLQTVVGGGISDEDDDDDGDENENDDGVEGNGKKAPDGANPLGERRRAAVVAFDVRASTNRTVRERWTVLSWWSSWSPFDQTERLNAAGHGHGHGRRRRRGRQTEPKVGPGVASISVLVEVFSRVDSIEGPEDVSGDELNKPRWPELPRGPSLAQDPTGSTIM